MAKLDTTIDNLELKSNKVLGNIPSSDWTDSQYPSAKTLYTTYKNLLDLTHPVGSIFVTSDYSENKAAELSEMFGGTWQLVDKTFKDTWVEFDSSCWTAGTAVLDLSGGSFQSAAYLIDHMISLRLSLKTTEEISDSDTSVVGYLNLDKLGIDRFSHAITNHVTISDGANSVIGYQISTDGKFSVVEVINRDGSGTLASGKEFVINLVLAVRHSIMKPEFCDKFYWKRVEDTQSIENIEEEIE